MKKREILKMIKRHCAHCPLKCDADCRLHPLKDGIDPTPRKPPTQKQLEALMLSSKRIDEQAREYRENREAGI